MNRELASARAKQICADSDVVAEVEQFVQLEALVADGIFLHVNLQALAALLQVAERGLATHADRDDASGHAQVDSRIFQLLRGLVRVVRQDLGNRVGEIVLATVRGLSEGLDLFQLLTPQFVNILVECQEYPLTESCAFDGAKKSKTLKRDYKQTHCAGCICLCTVVHWYTWLRIHSCWWSASRPECAWRSGCSKD